MQPPGCHVVRWLLLVLLATAFAGCSDDGIPSIKSIAGCIESIDMEGETGASASIRCNSAGGRGYWQYEMACDRGGVVGAEIAYGWESGIVSVLAMGAQGEIVADLLSGDESAWQEFDEGHGVVDIYVETSEDFVGGFNAGIGCL